MTTQALTVPVFREVDNNGNALVGGKLFTYIAGTTTPQATWTDATQTIQNTNPVILNARGEASVWGDITLTYKLVLQDSAGNAIWTQDQIPGGFLIPVAGGYVTTNQFPTLFNQNLTAPAIGQKLYPQTAAELAVSVTPTNFQYPPGYPERYYVGTFAYASDASGTTGTDFTTAIAVALSVAGQPARLGPFNYLFTNIVIPGGQSLLGVNHRLTNLVSKSGSSGIVMTDNGSAVGIILKDFAIYCNGPSSSNNTNYTTGVKFGYNASPLGTNALLDNLWIRDLPAGFPGLDISGNIWTAGYLAVQSTGGIRIVGSGASIDALEIPFSLGFSSSRTSTQVTAQFSGDAWIGRMENEAWASNVAAIEIDQLVSIGRAIFAFSNTGWTGDHVIQVTANAATWFIGGIVGYSAVGFPPTISSGWFKFIFTGTFSGGTGTHTAEGMNTGNVLSSGPVSPGTPALAAQAGSLYQGSGVPSNSNGNNGDIYFRTDTPGTANQRIYIKSAGTWTGIV